MKHASFDSYQGNERVKKKVKNLKLHQNIIVSVNKENKNSKALILLLYKQQKL